MDIPEDQDVPIILGRPFLATVGAIVDVKNGRIVFQVSDEMIGFSNVKLMTLNERFVGGNPHI